MTVISLLRGINLGGNRKILMSELRALYESLGLRGALTFIQSGNVVCHAPPRQDLRKLKAKIEAGIQSTFGFHSEVVLRTLKEWDDAIARNPFEKLAAEHPAKVLVAFLAEDPGEAARSSLMSVDTSPEQLHACGREVYIYYPNGVGRAKLSWTALDKLIGIPGTGRNWNTVLKLREMARKIEVT